jgi:hypothetical protein
MQGRFRDLFARQLEKALLKTSLSYRELAGDGFQLQHSLKVGAGWRGLHVCAGTFVVRKWQKVLTHDDSRCRGLLAKAVLL